MRSRTIGLVLALGLSLDSCKTVSTHGSSLAGADEVSAAEPATLVTTTIDDLRFKAFSVKSGGLVSSGSSERFLIDLRAAPKVYFVNANHDGSQCKAQVPDIDAKYLKQCYLSHYLVARNVDRSYRDDLAVFNQNTYFAAKKQFVAGTITSYNLTSGKIYAIQLYPQDSARDGQILQIIRLIKPVVHFQDGKLAFVLTGNQQSVAGIKGQLASEGVEAFPVSDLLGAVTEIPMNEGEAWGNLVLFPALGTNLLPTDIPIFDELPLDLSVVAGVVTKAFQDTNSHVNLKSKERKTPNVVIRDISASSPKLAGLINTSGPSPVHMIVTADGVRFEKATEEEVQAAWQKNIDKPWGAEGDLKWDARWSTLQGYTEMCPGQPSNCLAAAKYYGSKAANLGFLKEMFKNRKLDGKTKIDYDPVPDGLGIPFSYYLAVVKANPDLAQLIDKLAEDEVSNALIDENVRATRTAEVREAFLNAAVPPELLQAVVAKMKQVDPKAEEWKIRSSGNAEDRDDFDGAGLHDSYSSKLSKNDTPDHKCQLVASKDAEAGETTKMKVSPKTVACAIKGVYASLWNLRALDERNHARINPKNVAMGLAVLPSYDTESPVTANSVVVTRVPGSHEIIGYKMSVQKDNNTITNPTPGTQSEEIIATTASEDEPLTFTTLRYAKPTPTSPVLATSVLKAGQQELMMAFSRRVEEVYCQSKPAYFVQQRSVTDVPRTCDYVFFSRDKPKSLDMEMKILENGHFVVKQVREWSGT